jgi:hypothetical protein
LHSLPDGGVQRRGRIVIEIDARFTHTTPRTLQVPPLMPLPPTTRREV